MAEDELEALAARAAELGRSHRRIAADVLEHLVAPWAALRAYAGRPRARRTRAVSLPNVHSLQTFCVLARRTWPGRPHGIFDADHLRWFTLRDGLALCEQAGLEMDGVERIARPGRGPLRRPGARPAHAHHVPARARGATLSRSAARIVPGHADERAS